jgi:hypothetical protein
MWQHSQITAFCGAFPAHAPRLATPCRLFKLFDSQDHLSCRKSSQNFGNEVRRFINEIRLFLSKPVFSSSAQSMHSLQQQAWLNAPLFAAGQLIELLIGISVPVIASKTSHFL